SPLAQAEGGARRDAGLSSFPGIHPPLPGVLIQRVMEHDEHLSDRELGELARLADGTLRPGRRAAVEARVAASPRLRALAEEQRQAIALVRGAGGEAPAG